MLLAMTIDRSRALLIVLVIALPCSLLISVSSGVISIPLEVSVRSIGHAAGFSIPEIDPQHKLVLWSIRWPRTLLAALVGAGLAISGAAMQGLFRSPLADPSLIGVSSGAAAGAAAGIVMGSSIFPEVSQMSSPYSIFVRYYSISTMAFLGGFLAALTVYRLGTSRGATSVGAMLLAGIAIAALAGAVSNIFSFVADDIALRRINLWRMGSLDGANWTQVSIAASFIGMVILALTRYGDELNALLLGESEARHLGVNVQKIKIRLIAWTALGVGVAVSVSGVIAFVGLIVPHLIRLLIGPDHRFLLPTSALLGAILLVFSDSLSRTIIAPVEVPVGIVTALLGTPFFISLLIQQRKRLILM